jgi:histidyl-tRNA synthetase
MTLSTSSYKGARDFYPEDKRLQKYMFSKMREVCERFGYEEYDAPILEPSELFLAKGNQEIIDEQTYSFTDRGGRAVTVRTEMTPSVSRMVAGKRQELAYPLRWYSIPELWRYERMQRGRLRQFWQLNVDIFGVRGIEAEHEVIMLADQLLKSYGATEKMFTVRVNHRGLTNFLFGEYLGLNETQRDMLIHLIDRRSKIDRAVFLAQADGIFSPSQREGGALEKLLALLEIKLLNELPEEARSTAAVRELMQLDDMLAASGVTSVVFDISLMRGFDYYTGIVFEVFDEDPENNRAMFGGGRYDGLVGLFGVEPVPTVGFGMGDVTLQNFLESHGLLPVLGSETDVYVVLVGDTTYEQALPAALKLREMGLSVAVDMSGRKIEKQLKSADKKHVEFALFIGETELASEQYRLKNLHTGVEETHSLERIVSIVRDRRQSNGVSTATLLEDEL